jgi:threonine/homoserine/homoserine lactone efflux protein
MKWSAATLAKTYFDRRRIPLLPWRTSATARQRRCVLFCHTIKSLEVLRQGALVALLNPKITLFFAALPPQFMRSPSAPVLQALALSTMFFGVVAISDCAYVLAAAAIYPALRASPKAVGLGRYGAAIVYLFLSVCAAVAALRPGKA